MPSATSSGEGERGRERSKSAKGRASQACRRLSSDLCEEIVVSMIVGEAWYESSMSTEGEGGSSLFGSSFTSGTTSVGGACSWSCVESSSSGTWLVDGAGAIGNWSVGTVWTVRHRLRQN